MSPADEQTLVEDPIQHFDQTRRSGTPELNLIRHRQPAVIGMGEAAS
jgi:hypothetical protein